VLIKGDNIDALRAMPSDSVDVVVTDPPYGLSADPDIVAILAGWLKDGLTPDGAVGKGFMGKAWDSFVPPPAFWREVFRVMKPGAYAGVFAATRCEDVMGMSLRLAGFEIRDVVDWLYGSGFPKSHNVPMQLDKAAGLIGHRGKAIVVAGHYAQRNLENGGGVGEHEPISPLACAWEGYGTALKPGREPIFIVRKPPVGSIASNIERYGTGGINIDATRIGDAGGGTHCTNRDDAGQCRGHGNAGRSTSGETFHGPDTAAVKGRWPANVVLSHGPDCASVLAASGDHSVLVCAPGCPVAMLNAQSGKAGGSSRASGPSVAAGSQSIAMRQRKGTDKTPAFHGKTEGASAFFYVSKAARSERERGCEHLAPRAGFEAVERAEGSAGVNNPRAGAGRTAGEVRNHHPTVKPVAIMRWVVSLLTPPGGRVLDPFAGSGTTGVACIEAGIPFTLIEREPEYWPIIEGRCGLRRAGPFAAFRRTLTVR